MTNTTAFVSDVQLKVTDALPPITRRGHQVAAWEAMSRHFVDLDRQAGMVIMQTGGGKTVVAAGWELEHHIRRGGRVLWLAHRRSLLRQSHRTFHRLGNMAYPRDGLSLITISSLDAKWPMVTKDHDVVFSSMQSAVLESNWDFVELFLEESEYGVFVIVDEAHHAAAPGCTTNCCTPTCRTPATILTSRRGNGCSSRPPRRWSRRSAAGSSLLRRPGSGRLGRTHS